MERAASEASMEAILSGREKRALAQRELLVRYRIPLISYTLNIPGPIKESRELDVIHEIGSRIILKALEASGIQLINQQVESNPAGKVGFFSAAAPAAVLKQLAVDIEENHPLGRLFDIDILDENGGSINREALGYSFRGCLLCPHIPAIVCRRNQSHTLTELQGKIQHMISTYKEGLKEAT